MLTVPADTSQTSPASTWTASLVYIVAHGSGEHTYLAIRDIPSSPEEIRTMTSAARDYLPESLTDYGKLNELEISPPRDGRLKLTQSSARAWQYATAGSPLRQPLDVQMNETRPILGSEIRLRTLLDV